MKKVLLTILLLSSQKSFASKFDTSDFLSSNDASDSRISFNTIDSLEEMQCVFSEQGVPVSDRVFLAIDLEDTLASLEINYKVLENMELIPYNFSYFASPELFRQYKRVTVGHQRRNGDNAKFEARRVKTIKDNLQDYSKTHSRSLRYKFMESNGSMLKTLKNFVAHGARIEIFSDDQGVSDFSNEVARTQFLKMLKEELQLDSIVLHEAHNHIDKVNQVIRRANDLGASETFLIDNFLNPHSNGYTRFENPHHHLHFVQYKGNLAFNTAEKMAREMENAKRLYLDYKVALPEEIEQKSSNGLMEVRLQSFNRAQKLINLRKSQGM